jgi:hypothetical protein
MESQTTETISFAQSPRSPQPVVERKNADSTPITCASISLSFPVDVPSILPPPPLKYPPKVSHAEHRQTPNFRHAPRNRSSSAKTQTQRRSHVRPYRSRFPSTFPQFYHPFPLKYPPKVSHAEHRQTPNFRHAPRNRSSSAKRRLNADHMCVHIALVSRRRSKI